MTALSNGGGARVLNTTTGQLGNVVHHVIYNLGGWATKCKVNGGWTLLATDELITCSTCRRQRW